MRKLAIACLGWLLVTGSTTVATADEKGGKEDVSVTGEIVDSYCYASMGARGSSHKQCGLACAKKGIPVALVEKGTDKLYVLLPKDDKAPLPDAVVGKMGETVTLTGHTYAAGGSSFLAVESIK